VVALWAAQIVAAVAWFLEHGDGADPAEVAQSVAEVMEHGWSSRQPAGPTGDSAG
jgi:hypothetical protein